MSQKLMRRPIVLEGLVESFQRWQFNNSRRSDFQLELSTGVCNSWLEAASAVISIRESPGLWGSSWIDSSFSNWKSPVSDKAKQQPNQCFVDQEIRLQSLAGCRRIGTVEINHESMEKN